MYSAFASLEPDLPLAPVYLQNVSPCPNIAEFFFSNLEAYRGSKAAVTSALSMRLLRMHLPSSASLLMPMLTLGILPAVAGVLTGSFFTLAIGLAMIMGAGGDFTIFLKILFFRSSAKEMRFLDHPTQVGLVVFTR